MISDDLPARGQWLQRGLIVFCGCAAALPLAIRGNSCGHDFDFHLQSWLATAQDWHHAVFYPHWIEGANYGAGEPRFVFYPPITWMLGALLGIILPWAAVPVAFTPIVMIACGFSMYSLARNWMPSNRATVAACAYVLNPYALFVAYQRSAYGELAAGIWLPFVVLFALRSMEGCRLERSAATNKIVVLSGVRSTQSKDLRFAGKQTNAGAPSLDSEAWDPVPRSTIPLALAIAAIWLTNAPAAVMSCYLLIAIALWKAFTRKQWRPILQSAAGLILGLGLAAFYLLPAAYERRWVDIARAIGPGMRIEDSFLFGHTGESFHDHVLRTASWIFVTMLATIVLAAAIAWKRGTPRRALLPLFLTGAVLLGLQLPWSGLIWRIAPELKFLQFPWRWSLLLGMVFAISLAAAICRQSAESAQRFRFQAVAILIAAVALSSTASWLFRQPCDEQDAVSAQVVVFRSGAGFEGTDEYTPIDSDNSLIQQNLPCLRVLNALNAETVVTSNLSDRNPSYIPSDKHHLAISARIQQWEPERKTLTITAQSPGFAVFRLMDYPAWQVRANQAPITLRPHRDDGLMAIPIQPGSTRIEIAYAATPDVWCGRGFSAASLLVLMVLAVARKPALPG